METDLNSLDKNIQKFFEGCGRQIAKEVYDDIKKMAKNVIDHRFAFLQNRDSVKKVKEELNTNEHKFYENYIKDKNSLNSILVGLSLRRIDLSDDENKDKMIRNLIRATRNKYDAHGVHLAYVVQNGVLKYHIINSMEKYGTEVLFTKIKEFVDNIDNYVLFVYSGSNSDKVQNQARAKMNQHPENFIISGMGSAMEIVSEACINLKKEFEEFYDLQHQTDSKRKREMFVFEKKDEVGYVGVG